MRVPIVYFLHAFINIFLLRQKYITNSHKQNRRKRGKISCIIPIFVYTHIEKIVLQFCIPEIINPNRD